MRPSVQCLLKISRTTVVSDICYNSEGVCYHPGSVIWVVVISGLYIFVVVEYANLGGGTKVVS